MKQYRNKGIQKKKKKKKKKKKPKKKKKKKDEKGFVLHNECKSSALKNYHKKIHLNIIAIS